MENSSNEVNRMAEESDNLDSWGNILLDNLKKSYQLFGTKIDDHKDNQELKNALDDLDRIIKRDSVPAKEAKQIVKVEHKIVSEFNPRKYVDNKFKMETNEWSQKSSES